MKNLHCIIIFVSLTSQYSCHTSDNKHLHTKLEYQGINVKTHQVQFPEVFLTGSAYYPEQWESDFSKMKELGFNTLRMVEFAWSIFEPEERKFDFAWMDSAWSDQTDGREDQICKQT